MRIDILMATYNGEKYIGNQLRSLQGQTYKYWHLYVHDDGSTDNTVSIVKEFADSDKRIELIEDGKIYHNPSLNFMHLLSCSFAPYIIFCDQDDIWLENKLDVMLGKIREMDNACPHAVYSNAYVYDCGNALIGGKSTLCFPKTIKDVLFLNSGIQGCAIMFNDKLRDILKILPGHISMHDHVLTLAAVTFGTFTYIDKRLMLYRRYSETVTGRTDKNRKEKLGHFFEKGKTVLSKDHYNSIKAFYETYKESMRPEAKADYEDFFRFEKENRVQRILHACRGGFKLYDNSLILMFKLLIRPLL